MADQHFLMRWLGRYSPGVRLAVERGVASGVVSEYAYRNVPAGKGPVGRAIDRRFLSLQPWRDLREQASVTKGLVRLVVAERRSQGLPTTVLDVAAGSAPYLRELVSEIGDGSLSIHCFDRNAFAVSLGRQQAALESLSNIQFAVGDVLDSSSYLVPLNPDLLLAIGLFAHLRSDAEVRTVIQLAYESVAPGGYFVATCTRSPASRLSGWATRALGANTVFRPRAAISAWLVEAGFTDVSRRFVETAQSAVVGQKAPAG